MSQATRFTVLLIEPDTSLRRLIVLGLQHRGLEVIAVSSLHVLAEQSITHPDLLILDIDNGWRDDTSLLEKVQAHPHLSTLPMVVLVWDQMPPSSPTELPLLEYLAKPFDARQLHATLENLLETIAAIDLPAHQITAPATATSVSTASLSPLVTAAGLLLTVIGLMLQIVIAGLGLLIVLIALLWWTLGKRPEPQSLLTEVEQKYLPSL
jgi:DNA-binding response OmpR family regulator